MRPDDNDLDIGSDRGSDELRDVAREISARLASLGIWLDGRESAETLVRIEEAVERFEQAVRAKGGDLMVDEPPAGQPAEPDRPGFGLPVRRADERAADYIARLNFAADSIRHRSPIE